MEISISFAYRPDYFAFDEKEGTRGGGVGADTDHFAEDAGFATFARESDCYLGGVAGLYLVFRICRDSASAVGCYL